MLNVHGPSRQLKLSRAKTLALVIAIIVAAVGALLIEKEVSSASVSPSAAQSACASAGKGFGTVSSVDGAYQTTAQAFQSWAEKNFPAPPSPSEFPASASSDPIAVCYLSGTFDSSIPMAPGSSGYTNLIVTVDESTGSVTLDLAASSGKWGFSPPPVS